VALPSVYDLGASVRLRLVFTADETVGAIEADTSLLTVLDASGYAEGDDVLVENIGPLGGDLATTISDVTGNVLTLAATASRRAARAPVGRLVDPDTVALSVEQPDGTPVDVTPENPSAGVYEGTFTPTQAGDHYYRGAGDDDAAGEELFVVRPRRVEATP
jgi:hypothetical protein